MCFRRMICGGPHSKFSCPAIFWILKLSLDCIIAHREEDDLPWLLWEDQTRNEHKQWGSRGRTRGRGERGVQLKIWRLGRQQIRGEVRVQADMAGGKGDNEGGYYNYTEVNLVEGDRKD